jgi:uncharacterized protein HemX
MTLDEFRREMNAYWQSALEKAKAEKHPYFMLDMLHTLYRKFDVDERQMADQVISEWLFAENESKRACARSLIVHQNIVTAVSALRESERHLASSTEPNAASELKAVRRTIEELGK